MSLIENINDSNVNFIGNGVNNCGSSCFFNSTNQMLFHIVEFREFLINHKYLFENNMIILSLINLFETMKNGNIIKSNDIIDKKTKKLVDFYYDIQQFYFDNPRAGSQEDAGELLRYYLNGKSSYKYCINQTINEADILINKNESSSNNKLEFNDYFYKYNINLPIYDFISIKNKSFKCKNGQDIKIYDETNEFLNYINIDYDQNIPIDINTIKQ